MTTNDSYHVGGNVPKDHPSYVYRRDDFDLTEWWEAHILLSFIVPVTSFEPSY